MTGWLVSILNRRSRLARRLTVASLGVVALSIAVSALAPARHSRHSAGQAPTASSDGPQVPVPPRHPSPVSAGELARARATASRFLSGYLRLVYGHGSARSIDAVTPNLRVLLTRDRPEVTPVERHRHPRLVSLTAVGQAPGVVLASALVEDGGVTTYALRISLREGPSGWRASAVDGG